MPWQSAHRVSSQNVLVVKSKKKNAHRRWSLNKTKGGTFSDEEHDDVVCNLNSIDEYYCTDETQPNQELCRDISAPYDRGEDPRVFGQNPFVTATGQSYPNPPSSAASSTTTYAGDVDVAEYVRLFNIAVETRSFEEC